MQHGAQQLNINYDLTLLIALIKYSSSEASCQPVVESMNVIAL